MPLGRHPRRPQIGDRLFDRLHAGQPRRGHRRRAGETIRRRLDDGPRVPQRSAARDVERLTEHAGGGKCLELFHRDAGHAPHEIFDVVERSRCLDARGELGADAAHRTDTETHGEAAGRLRVGLQPRVGARRVDVGSAHDHTVTSRVLHQRVRRPEPHRLRVDERGTKDRRLVQLDPRRRVHEVGEAHRMTLGKPVVGEGRHLVEDLVGHRTDDAALRHAFVQPVAQASHARPRTFRAHRLAQLVGLRRREAGDVDGHLHELLLEQRHTERLAEAVFQQRMQVGDGLLPVATANVRVHRAALNRAGTDERDLDDEVVEPPRLEARQRGHLRARFHLEHPDAVGTTQHGVHLVFLRDLRQVDAPAAELFDVVDRTVQRREHSEPE